MGKNLPADLKKIVEELKGSSEDALVNYDMKTYFSTLITDGANAKLKKCNENLSEGDKLKADFEFDRLDPWKKMCCYKIAPNTFDCDVSLRNMVIYGIAFPFVLENNRHIELQKGYKYCFRSDDDNIFEYRGDTMNSYATTVQEFLRKYNEKLDIYDSRKGKPYLKAKYSCWSACVLDNYDYFKAILPAKAKEFIRINHTIGNFIPTPKVFNSTRYSKTKDYWDLTLLRIWSWYMKREELQGDNASNYYDWFNVFKNWDDFVEKNYMQDFVNGGNAGHKYGMPKELWKGHFNPLHSVLPENKDDFSQFFTNASEWITKRGTNIAKKLKKKLDEENVSEIVNKLLGNDEG